MIIGIDDTDTLGTPGTNQLARRLYARLPFGCRGERIVRHQLFFDPRVPYTSHNGSASILVTTDDAALTAQVIEIFRAEMLSWFVPSSDPGLCVFAGDPADLPAEVIDWGRRCQRDVVTQDEARALAARLGIHLEGLGGTEGGVIGALAAVGLCATADDGRVIHIAGWPRRDDTFGGVHAAAEVFARGVDTIVRSDTGAPVAMGEIDLGKKLRPNVRGGKIVLLVAPRTEGEGPELVAVRQH